MESSSVTEAVNVNDIKLNPSIDKGNKEITSGDPSWNSISLSSLNDCRDVKSKGIPCILNLLWQKGLFVSNLQGDEVITC